MFHLILLSLLNTKERSPADELLLNELLTNLGYVAPVGANNV